MYVLKLYLRAIGIMTHMIVVEKRHVDLRNRIEDSEINPHSCSHFIFNKDAKDYIEKKKIDSSTNVLGKAGF